MTFLKSEKEIVSRLAVCMFLQKFYSEQLNRIDSSTWNSLITSLTEETKHFKEERIHQGLQLLSQFKEEDLTELEYDFNRLFVGPNKLEASPYESSYLNQDNALMQRETLAVRSFYEMAGLEVAKKNTDPDDHLALELEFVCYLLEQGLEDESSLELYKEFLKKHLFVWIPTHVFVVNRKTTNSIILGISMLLEGFINEEKMNFGLIKE